MPNFDITQTPRRASLYTDRRTEKVPLEQPITQSRSRHYRRTVMGWMIFGMVLFGAVIMTLQFFVVPWIHGLEVHWVYGQDNVSVFGADVGHGGVSRFIAFENGQEIVIVEVVQKKYSVYTIPVSGASDNQLITLSVQDVNWDGKPDLIVHLDGQEGSFALINTGTQFSWNSK